MKLLLVCTLILFCTNAKSQRIRFVHISDTHIGSPNGHAEEDLRRTVEDINNRNDIEFVVITGDITELGTREELTLAKRLFDSLHIKWYIIPGNHDTGWSESGGDEYTNIFGYDKFVFDHKGIRFFGCPSGPYVRMSDGHIPRSSLNWIDSILNASVPDQRFIFLNHYPIDPGLDNWYEITGRLALRNTLAILCGHGHANRVLNFDGIPGFMGRSNLRARAAVGGYNIVDIVNDSIFYTEVRPKDTFQKTWASAKLRSDRVLSRNTKWPTDSVNLTFKNVSRKWTYASDANIISTPASDGKSVYVGNQAGKFVALHVNNGSKLWEFQTNGSIFSSPAIYRESVVFGSADGFVYNVTTKGKLKWKFKAIASVLGSPVIENETVYIGASGAFYAIDLGTGQQKWVSREVTGAVVSTPVLTNNIVIFGAWDRHLYALNKHTGALLWKWNNGSPVRNYSPASCIPVVVDTLVFIVAPDRYITAISLNSGKTVWRNNDATVRESIGVSSDKKWIYGKTMQDTIAFYRVSPVKQFAEKMHAGFGYEHVPSMLIEKNSLLLFGTKNGVIYAIEPLKRKVAWKHKIDNSMVNTVNPNNKGQVLVSTMDGKVVLLQYY